MMLLQRYRAGATRCLTPSISRHMAHRGMAHAAGASSSSSSSSTLHISNLFGVEGKVVLVTGGGTGIGRMITQGFVDNGARVYIASRKEAAKAAREIQEQSPHPAAHCRGISADLTTEEGQSSVIEEVAGSEGGKLHVLVNNSGTNWNEPMETFPLDAFDKVMAINVKAVFGLTRRALPLLESAGTEEDPARIINIGSIDAMRVTMVDTFAYSASKAAVHRLTQTLAGKLGHRHITVNAIAPGPFQSKMMKVTIERAHDQIIEGTVMGRIGSPEDMAGTAIWLASRAGAFVTGAIVTVDGGICVKPRL